MGPGVLVRAQRGRGTFCSKTGPFFACGCSKDSRVPVCPRRPRSSLDVSSERRDLHLASAGPSLEPSANLEVALFLCVCLL